jgi:hypothetical protein
LVNKEIRINKKNPQTSVMEAKYLLAVIVILGSGLLAPEFAAVNGQDDDGAAANGAAANNTGANDAAANGTTAPATAANGTQDSNNRGQESTTFSKLLFVTTIVFPLLFTLKV